MQTDIDILSFIVISVDIIVVAFLMWRVFDKKATLWGAARIIYGWVILLTSYHCLAYIMSFFAADTDKFILRMLHPFVVLYMINPLLIAIIHWKGGHIWK